MERPEFQIEKYLEETANPRAKASALKRLAAPFKGEPCLDMMAARADEFLERFHKLSKKYSKEGLDDQELAEMGEEFSEWFNKVFRFGKWQWMITHDSTIHALYQRGKKMGNLLSATDQFVQLSADEAMLNLEMNKTPEQIENERTSIENKRNEVRNVVFSWIASAYQLSDEEYEFLETLFDSEMIDAYTKQLLVAGVMLSAIEFYESGKTVLLYKLSQNHSDITVRQRALVALVMVSVVHQHDPKIKQIVADLGSDKVMRYAILDIQKVMHLMETVEEDSNKAVGTMLKGMLTSASKDMAEHLNEEGILDQDIEVPLDLEKEFETGIKDMFDSQQEGVDIYYNQFKDLKKVGFFHSLYNWFVPYYYENSALSSVRDHLKAKADLFKILPYVSNLCDNDIYTMALSSLMSDDTPTYSMSSTKIEHLDDEDDEAYGDDEAYEDDEAYDDNAENEDGDENEGGDEYQDDEAYEEDEDRPESEYVNVDGEGMSDAAMKEILRRKYEEVTDPNRKLSDAERYKEEREFRHKFIHDLYRFYYLAPMKSSFTNPFRENMDRAFITQDYYKDSVFDKVRLSLARFAVRRKEYGFLYEMLMLVENPTTEQTFMRAMACNGTDDYEEALLLLQGLYDKGESPKACLHMMLDCYEKMGSKKAIDVFHQLEADEADEDKKMQLKLRELDFYLYNELWKEALSLAYSLDNEYPKVEIVECRLAEALMYVKPYQEQNVRRAKDMLAPYIHNFKNQLQEKGLMEKAESPEDMKKKMAALFSMMLEHFSGNVDKEWESRKNRAYGLCVWIVDGPSKAVQPLLDSYRSRDRQFELGTKIFHFEDRELDLLHSLGIRQEAIYLMTERLMFPDIHF